MRILVDSSAWIEFLNGNPSQTAEEVSRLLGSEHVLSTCGLIVAEVFQGLRRKSGFGRVTSMFEDLDFLEPTGIETYLRAAEVYRELRSRGITVRSTIDCILAALAEEHGCSVLARDRDLETILGSGLLKAPLLS